MAVWRSNDAATVTYTPAVATDWDSDADPGNANAAFDQLAERVDDLEAGGGGAPDAAVVTYTPTVATDWDSDADPGNLDDALDQLAERVDDLEGGAGHAAVTLGADAGAILGLTDQELTLDTQTANLVLAGPTTGAAADPTFRALVAADMPADAALWSIIQAAQCANEVMNWPANVGIDIDLDAGNLWWDKVGTPTTAPTMVDVAGEAGITETWEYAMKVVADASGEGFLQRFTYANQPRVKSGRKLSAIAAVWVGTAGSTVTMKLITSDSTTVSATATAQAWTIIKCENLTLDGSYVDLQFTIGGADTFYVVPLGVNAGEKSVPLAPRGLRYVTIAGTTLVNNVDPGGADFTDVDCTTATSSLCAAVNLTGAYQDNSGSENNLAVRRNGDSTAQALPQALARSSGVATVYGLASKQIAVDDGQIFEYKTGVGVGTTEAVFIMISGFWEWA